MIDVESFFEKLRRGEWDVDASTIPPVNELYLRRYINRELSPDESRAISRLIVTNVEWREHYFRMIALT